MVAHIHAFEDDGPRAIKAMLGPDRNAFPNLILLCGPCHDIVDHDEVTYHADLLREWKAEREKEPQGTLAGLRDLDQASMEAMLNDAMKEVREDMSAVADMFPELTQLLRGVMEHYPRLDPESISLLHDAATNLVGLPDSAQMLHSASRGLHQLPDSAEMLRYASRDLHQLPDSAEMLRYASRDLHQLPDSAEMLLHASRDLKGLRESAVLLAEAAKALSHLPDTVVALLAVAQEVRGLPQQNGAIDEAVKQVEAATRALSSANATLSQEARYAKPAPSPTPRIHVSPRVQFSDRYWYAMLIGWAGWGVVIVIAVVHAKSGN
ncbi:hypothetical protein [Actinomadura sp. NPDC000600]|uniref:hypothetical protein n=1 Tax=Actinomadura sp. NPDC000600 TaxID=3154262 RepID=UPI0033919B5B